MTFIIRTRTKDIVTYHEDVAVSLIAREIYEGTAFTLLYNEQVIGGNSGGPFTNLSGWYVNHSDIDNAKITACLLSRCERELHALRSMTKKQ